VTSSLDEVFFLRILNLNMNNKMEKKKIVIVGAGVAGINAATKIGR
jgi:heterodisulfide reductase subunit A-like polyferredoxin